MIAEKSRRDILIYAMSVARTIALSTLTAVAADAAHRPGRYAAMSRKMVFRVGLALASLLLANIGFAGDSAPLHEGPWPIRSGHNYQPTEHELRALHLEDVTPDQAREIDRLYDQLLTPSENVLNRHPAPTR